MPVNKKGSVNVLELCRQLSKIDPKVKSPNDAQHLHGKDDLKDMINTVAAEQGVNPIGIDSPENEIEDLENRLQKTAKQAKEDAVSAVEANAAHEALLEEMANLRKAHEEVKLERDALKERLRQIEDNGILFNLS